MYQRNPLSIEAIMARGRWASSKSARHYIQQGPALLLSVKAPPDVAKAGTLFAAAGSVLQTRSRAKALSGWWSPHCSALLSDNETLLAD
jgi:hypothetical protein